MTHWNVPPISDSISTNTGSSPFSHRDPYSTVYLRETRPAGPPPMISVDVRSGKTLDVGVRADVIVARSYRRMKMVAREW